MMLQISFNDVDIVDGYYYAASNTQNGLYRFNEEGCELICRFGEEENIENLFMQTIMYDERIIFTPSSAENIYIYDVHKGKIIQIPFINRGCKCGKFHGIAVWKNYAFLICHNYPVLIKLNIETYEIEYLEDATKVLYTYGYEKSPLLTYGYIVENILYATPIYTNIILELNLETGSSKVRIIENVGKKIWGYYIDGNIEYVLSSEGFFIIQNGIIYYKETINNLSGDKYLFSTCMSCESIFFVPCMINYSAVPLKVSRVIDLTKTPIIKTVITENKCMFGPVKEKDNNLYMSQYRNGTFVVYKIEEDKVITYKSTKKMGMITESKMYNLSEWIKLFEKQDVL